MLNPEFAQFRDKSLMDKREKWGEGGNGEKIHLYSSCSCADVDAHRVYTDDAGTTKRTVRFEGKL